MSEDLISVLDRLADDSEPVRQIDLAGLSDIPRGQVATFHAAWNGLSPERRLEVAQALVEGAEANIHLNFYLVLRELLADGDAQVRKLAIEGLWEDNRTNLVAPLANLVAGDPSVDVRAAAAISLGRFVMLGSLGEINEAAAEQAEAALRSAWNRRSEVTEVRRRALEGLAYSEGADVRQMIQVAYYDEDDLLRQSAVYAMGRSADRRWAKNVLAELDSSEVAMRFEATVAAGELGLASAVDPLIRRLDDPDGSVRSAAATALGEIGGPAARRALRAAARTDDEGLAEAAQAALDELNFSSGAVDQPMFEFQEQAALVPGEGDLDEDEDEGEPLGLGAGLFGDEFDEDEEDEEEGDLFDYDEDDLDWLDEDEEADDGDDDLGEEEW
ncbi:MAG TPA: HEAT repeat domain-containing protein [Anaerolineae bacterium]